MAASPRGGSGGAVYKILLVGDSGVGKTCLIRRYAEGAFNEDHIPLGADYKERIIDLNGRRTTLQLWDSNYERKFKGNKNFPAYAGADGVMIVYDVTDRDTFDSVRVWLDETDQGAGRHITRIAVGNKIDRPGDRQIDRKAAKDFLADLNCTFYETSALAGTEVDEAFASLARAIKNRLEDGLKLKPQKKKKSGCELL